MGVSEVSRQILLSVSCDEMDFWTASNCNFIPVKLDFCYEVQTNPYSDSNKRDKSEN